MPSTDDISLIFKVSGGTQFTISVPKNLTIREMKEKVSEPSKIPISQQRLIYKGRILKDNDRLDEMRVENGHTMHLVRSGAQIEQNKTQSTNPVSESNNSSINNQAPNTNSETSTSSVPVTGNNTNDSFATIMSNLMNNNFDLGFQSQNSRNNMQGNIPNQFGGMGTIPNSGTMGNIPDFSSLLNSPLFQQSMTELANNPQLVRNLLRSNPMFNQLSANNPMLEQMLNNPEMLRMMLNPQIIQTVLNSNNPNNNSSTNGNSFSAFNGIPNPSQLGNMLSDPAVASMISGMMSAGNLNTNVNNNTNNIPSSQLYTSQLNQLRDMGFIDTDASLSALQETGGDINAAINKLLERGVGQ